MDASANRYIIILSYDIYYYNIVLYYIISWNTGLLYSVLSLE